MKHRILTYNKNGYIAICANCGNYQLSFGTTGICLNFEDFMELADIVFEESDILKDIEFPDVKCIQLPTTSKKIQIILTYNELLKLKVLIEEAIILVQAYNAMNSLES